MEDDPLEFTSWDSYTDSAGVVHSLDWSSPAAMRGQFAYPYIEAIRQAVNERLDPFGCKMDTVQFPHVRRGAYAVLISALALTRFNRFAYTHVRDEITDEQVQAWWAVAQDVAALTRPASDLPELGLWQAVPLHHGMDHTYSGLWGYAAHTASSPHVVWIDGASFSSIKDAERYSPTSVLAYGEWASMPVLDSCAFTPYGWYTAGDVESATIRLMDAAGVTDTYFRTWFLALDGGAWWAYFILQTQVTNVLPLSADLLYNLKLMLSKLTCCVTTQTYSKENLKYKWVYNDRDHQTYEPLPDLVSRFNMWTNWVDYLPPSSEIEWKRYLHRSIALLLATAPAQACWGLQGDHLNSNILGRAKADLTFPVEGAAKRDIQCGIWLRRATAAGDYDWETSVYDVGSDWPGKREHSVLRLYNGTGCNQYVLVENVGAVDNITLDLGLDEWEEWIRTPRRGYIASSGTSYYYNDLCFMRWDFNVEDGFKFK